MIHQTDLVAKGVILDGDDKDERDKRVSKQVQNNARRFNVMKKFFFVSSMNPPLVVYCCCVGCLY